MPDITITLSENGRYIVAGDVRLTAPDGREIEHPTQWRSADTDTRRTSRSATGRMPRSTSTARS
jgi:hypothetical protein